VRQAIQNVIQQPERVIRLPVYLLRWLPYVSTQIVFLVAAFWQEYYLASKNSSAKDIPSVNTRAENVCQWAGISRAQFFRLLHAGSKVEWFIQKETTNHRIDPRTGKPKKSANRYLLHRIYLTPGDAEDLKAFLIKNNIQNNPVNALKIALQVNLKEILHDPPRQPSDNWLPLRSAQQIVRDLVGDPLNNQLTPLVNQLSLQLLCPDEFIRVTWYFLKNWLPRLGPDAAMFILMLRNLCYFNPQTGELRDEVWIEGGYAGIAARLGIPNPQTIAQWLPAIVQRKPHETTLTERTQLELARRKRLQNLLGQFVIRTNYKANTSGGYAWKFKVERLDPLIPEHEQIAVAIHNLISQAEQNGMLPDLIACADKDCFETHNPNRTIVMRHKLWIENCPATLHPWLEDCFATLKADPEYCFETLLKILKFFKDSNGE
jgi:hypothetical protein